MAFSLEVVLPGNPSLQPVCDSLTKLYACICAWWAAKRGFDLRATSNQMQRWQKEHLELFCSTYSKEACRPKNHFSLHVPLQWKEHNFTLDCYPCERKHKLFKTIAPNFNELSKFSLSILSEMTHREIHSPPNHFLEATLLGKKYTCVELQACFDSQDLQLAPSLEYRGVRYGKGQYKVLSARKAVLIQAAAQCQGSFPLAIYWHALSAKLRASPSGSKKMTAMLCGSFLWMTLLAVFMPVVFAKSAKTARQLFHSSISDSHAHRAKKM